MIILQKMSGGIPHQILHLNICIRKFVRNTNYDPILTSSDGISWTSRTSGTSNSLVGVTYGNGLFVSVGQGGTILTSTDGTTWTSRTSGTSGILMEVTYSQ